MSRRALVVGGTGYVGSRLTAALAARGWCVTTFALTGPASGPARFVRGDRRDPADLRRLRQLGDQDALIDLVAYRAEDTRALAERCAGSARRFVHLSTVAVYRRLLAQVAGENATERWPRRDGFYGADKAQCERELEAAWESSRLPSTILRAAPIMGPADPVSREHYVFKRILAKRPLLHPGPLDGYVSLLYIDDLVDALVRAAESAHPGCRAYHLALAEPLTLAQHVSAIGRFAGCTDVQLEALPPAGLAQHGLRLCAFPFASPSKQRLGIARAAGELGFSPTPYARALERTLAWFSEHTSSAPAWPGRGSTQSRLCGVHEWLHADQENGFRNSLAPVRLDRADELLEWLSGVHVGDERCVVLPPAAWPDPDPMETPVYDHVPAKAFVLPAQVLERLTGADVSSPSSAAPHWRLAGVVEPAGRERGWLYAQVPQRDPLAYGTSDSVLDVRFVGFRELDPDGAGECERIVVGLHDEDDAGAFADWLLACEERGHVDIASLASYSRVFLTRLCRWLLTRVAGNVDIASPAGGAVALCPCAAGGSQCTNLPPCLARIHAELHADAPGAGAWAAIYDLARLLQAADLGSPPVRLRVSTQRRPLVDVAEVVRTRADGGSLQLAPSLVLFAVADEAYLADLPRRRLLELSPALVAALEAARRGTAEAALGERHRRRVRELTQMGVLRRVPAPSAHVAGRRIVAPS